MGMKDSLGEQFYRDRSHESVRASDPVTSHKAARKPRKLRDTDRLLALKELALRSLTDHELAAKTGKQKDSIGKRRTELRDDGFVRDSGITRPSPAGSDAIVWEITEAGREALENLLSEMADA